MSLSVSCLFLRAFPCEWNRISVRRKSRPSAATSVRDFGVGNLRFFRQFGLSTDQVERGRSADDNQKRSLLSIGPVPVSAFPGLHAVGINQSRSDYSQREYLISLNYLAPFRAKILIYGAAFLMCRLVFVPILCSDTPHKPYTSFRALSCPLSITMDIQKRDEKAAAIIGPARYSLRVFGR